MTGLHYITTGGHAGAARVLMRASTEAGLLDGRVRGALHYAVEGRHLQLVRNLIAGGADLNAGDHDGDRYASSPGRRLS